jgi:hypothetical protein
MSYIVILMSFTAIFPSIGYAQNEYTAVSIKVVHEQSGKVEYERERLLGTALKIQ